MSSKDCRMKLIGIVMTLFASISCNSLDGKCGWARLNSQTTICCNGLIYIRRGIQPMCCSNIAYDGFSAYCCKGKVQPKTKANRCCGETTYDTRYQVCQQRKHTTPTNLPGSTCCLRKEQWQCCSQGKNCCQQEVYNYIEVPGFRPVCCGVSSIGIKIRCCRLITERTGAVPSCCHSVRVKPKCCIKNGLLGPIRNTCCNNRKCCKTDTINFNSNINNPYHYPAESVPIKPKSAILQQKPSRQCCSSYYPRPSCCRRMFTSLRQHGNSLMYDKSSTCCNTQYSGRYSNRMTQCCRSKIEFGRKSQCCKRQYATMPVRQIATKQSQGRHKCYHCQFSNTHHDSEPLIVKTRDQGHHANDNSEANQGQDWARLSCCQSIYYNQCCRNSYRLTGFVAECCNAYFQETHNYGHDKRNIMQRHLSTNGLQGSSSVCFGRPYNTNERVCCNGVLGRRASLDSSCCGTQVFDSATHKCCSGTIQIVC